MIGPILLAISWMLLRLEGKGLSAIGIDRPVRRFAEFSAGFVVLGAAAALQQAGLSVTTGDPFVPNPSLESSELLHGARLVLNSVLYEELIFRGYLLYQAVRFLGPNRAVWLDAAVFGIYHWFTYEAFGNLGAMAYLLVITGAYGLMWARAFVATGSVAAPIGLHLGWNAVSYLLFSAGPFGAAILVPESGVRQIQATGWASLVLTVIWPLAITTAVLLLCRHYERRVGAMASAGTPTAPPNNSSKPTPLRGAA